MPFLDKIPRLEEENDRLRARLARLERKESECQAANSVLQIDHNHYHFLVENTRMGYAYFQMIIEDDQAVDLLYMEVNPAFEQLTGLKDVVGCRITEVLPDIKQSNPELLPLYGRVAQTGQPEKIETYVEPLKCWLDISLVSPEKGFVIALFDNITQRKQAEKLLRQSEARLKQVTGTARLGIWEWDLATDDVSWNDELLNIYGIPRQEFTGKGQDYISMTRADYRETQVKNIDLAMKNGVTETEIMAGNIPKSDLKELCVVRPDGSERFTLGDAITIVDETGKPLRMLGVSFDITTHKQAEIALQENEEKFRLLYQLLPVGISVVNQHNQVIEQNPALERILDISKEGLQRGDYRRRRYLRSDGTPMPEEEFPRYRTLSGGESFAAAEIGIVKEDDSVIWTEVSAAACSLGHWKVALVTNDITQRKLAEIALRESEEKYRSLFEASMDAIMLSRPDGRIVAANPAACHIFGRTEAEIIRIGRNGTLDVTDPRLPSALVEREHTCRFMGELNHMRKDGSIFPAELTSVIHQTSSGETYTHTILRDITRRKQADSALRESEEKYRSLFEASMDAIIIGQPDGRILAANPAACRFFGYTEEELINSGRPQIMDTHDPHLVQALAERDRIGKFSGELTCVRKDGSTFPVELTSVIYQTPGGETYTQNIFRDLSQRKQAEADLRDSEEKHRAVFNNDVYAISIFDIQSQQFLDVNDAFCRIFGYTRAEALGGLTVFDITAEPQISDETINTTLQAGIAFVPLRMLRKKDGTIFPVEIVGSPYLWKDKKVMFSLAHDITARRQMEQELLQLNTHLEQLVLDRTLELQQANRALADAQETERRALALELHDELGQVLNRVKLSLDLVSMLKPEDSQKQFDLARDLVRDLINRVRRITLELRPSMLDDLGLLPSLRWLFTTFFEQTSCQVQFKGANLNQRFSPRVEITSFRIIQEALTNIIRHAANKAVGVQVRADDKAMHIRISDQGGGFNIRAALEKKASTGLSGMRERARQLGGELTIESTPGQGTTITAVLPLKSQTGPLSGALPRKERE